MKLKTPIILIILCFAGQIKAFKQGPEIQAGLFQNYSSVKLYNNKKGPYLQIGYNISRYICLTVYGTAFNGNRYNQFYPQLIAYGMDGFMQNGKNDTFYNINSTTSYKVSQFLLKLKITLNPDSKLQFSLMPALGFSHFKESFRYTPDIHWNEDYTGEYPCFQIGAGMSVFIDKDRKIRLCTELQTSITASNRQVLDAYNPAFNNDNTIFRQMSFGMNYRFN